jgi:hypothetical protein
MVSKIKVMADPKTSSWGLYIATMLSPMKSMVAHRVRKHRFHHHLTNVKTAPTFSKRAPGRNHAFHVKNNSTVAASNPRNAQKAQRATGH